MNSETIRTHAPAASNSAKPANTQRVLFVCYGNICRSPSAQGIFSHLAEARHGGRRFVVDSAGTHDFHVGKAPDARAIRAARRAGVDISTQRARQLCRADFEAFDHIFVMDEHNRRCLADICPPEHVAKVKPILPFAGRDDLPGVPDPFRGEEKDFDDMVELLFDVCGATLDALDRRAA